MNITTEIQHRMVSIVGDGKTATFTCTCGKTGISYYRGSRGAGQKAASAFRLHATKSTKVV